MGPEGLGAVSLSGGVGMEAPVAAESSPSSAGPWRSSSPGAREVSADLRRGEGEFLRRRRRIAALSLAGSGAMAVVAAYQNGLLGHLPEPPVALFDADEVDASGEAYQVMRTPDAALGLLGYAATLVLAGIGSGERATRTPLVPVALAAKVGLDAAAGLFLAAEQAVRHRRFCSWCLVATAASLAMVPQVLPEARHAVARLRSR